MFELSKDHNPNYVASVEKVTSVRDHPNADRLGLFTVAGSELIGGKDVKVGDWMIYFPVESKLSSKYLSETNSYRKPELNSDPDAKPGFFEHHGRVKAINLRSVIGAGYAVPMAGFTEWVGSDEKLDEHFKFDTVDNELLIEKYMSVKEQRKLNDEVRKSNGKKPKLSRLIDGQVLLHNDTENLRRNLWRLNPSDVISVSYKLHGTSYVASNVLTNRALSWYEKLAKKLGVVVDETEYDVVYSSRNVIKNKDMKDPKNVNHYYSTDVWSSVTDDIKHKIPKGYCLYGEIVGYTKEGQPIQKGYDYGCNVCTYDFYVYRVSMVNDDGLRFELDGPQIVDFCEKHGFKTPKLFYHGPADGVYNYLNTSDVDKWRSEFLIALEGQYNEKNCYMCNKAVPEEGVVVRTYIDNSKFTAMKLKSNRFLYETETLQYDNEKEN